MNTHKTVAIASGAAILVALGGGALAFGVNNTKQENHINAQVQAADEQVTAASKALRQANAQLASEKAKNSKVYNECLAEAKVAKASASVCAD